MKFVEKLVGVVMVGAFYAICIAINAIIFTLFGQFVAGLVFLFGVGCLLLCLGGTIYRWASCAMGRYQNAGRP